MKAEIISIGTEITTGRNLDTNSQWLSRRLAEIGIPVGYHTTVADDLEDNVAVFRTAANRANLVIVTGGLGPTLDDLTREALAKAAGVELVFDAAVLDQIRAVFARRNRVMPERNRVQAYRPAGAENVPNPLGTAPGIWMRLGDRTIIALPGVPSELHAMFEQTVRPRLLALGLGGGVLIERKINTFGLGESAVEEQLADLTARGRDPEVGITASDAVIALRIVARAATAEEARRKIEPVERTIRDRLGPIVFGTDDETMAEILVRSLKEQNRSVAVAESLTGGNVAALITAVPGASEVFRGGVVAYTHAAKQQLLDVPAEMLRTHGPVSAPVAEAMAVAARTRFGSDIAVSTTGWAGPDAGDGQPVGLTYIGLATPSGLQHFSTIWGGTRSEIQSRAAKSALNAIRLWLQK